jgi:UDP-N-acetyl-2-amino-2-deoxyglucuronate dehydrogenase
MNIGIHLFDMLQWIFGAVEKVTIHQFQDRSVCGSLFLERAEVHWYLSVDFNDLPDGAMEKGQTTHRSIKIDGEEVDFTLGFTDLHTTVYEEILAGRGYGIEDARPSIELVDKIRKLAK